MAHVKAEDDPLYFVVWRDRVIIPVEPYPNELALDRAANVLRLIYGLPVVRVATVRDVITLLH